MSKAVFSNPINRSHMPWIYEQNGHRILIYAVSVDGKSWRLNYTDWDDEADPSHPLFDGVEKIHCTPTAFVDGSGLHINFIAGDPSSYQLFEASGIDITHLGDPTVIPLPKMPWTAFRSPVGTFFAQPRAVAGVTTIGVELAGGGSAALTTNFAFLYRVSYDPRDTNKIIICGADHGGKISSVFYDFAHGSVLGKISGEDIYKAAVWENELVFAERLGVARDDRQLRWLETFEIVPAPEIKIVKT